MGKQRPDGWWYPWIFVGGFIVVLGVNLVLLYFATSTFDGLETRHAFEEGNRYNAEIAAEKKQKALGWQVDLAASEDALDGKTVPGGPRAGYPLRLTLTVRDASGAAVEGLQVDVQVRRPTREGYDRSVTLDPLAPGKYARTVVVPLPGQWEVRLVARRGEDAYRLRQRIAIR